jgi:excisionase family DNA binding protein
MDKMLGIEEVCGVLGISVMTLYRIRQNNGFPHPAIKIGKKLIRWTPSQIEEWVAQQGLDFTHKN